LNKSHASLAHWQSSTKAPSQALAAEERMLDRVKAQLELWRTRAQETSLSAPAPRHREKLMKPFCPFGLVRVQHFGSNDDPEHLCRRHRKEVDALSTQLTDWKAAYQLDIVLANVDQLASPPVLEHQVEASACPNCGQNSKPVPSRFAIFRCENCCCLWEISG
jgi:hypothetical protein